MYIFIKTVWMCLFYMKTWASEDFLILNILLFATIWKDNLPRLQILKDIGGFVPDNSQPENTPI